MEAQTITAVRSPPGHPFDFDLLQRFEQCLDTLHPEACPVPCRVRGYGEISTVLEILDEGMQGLVFKRMSIFDTLEELDEYLTIYLAYNRLLVEQVGINLPENGYAVVLNSQERPIFYIIQENMPAFSFGNRLLHLLSDEEGVMLVMSILRELLKIWIFNSRQSDFEIGLDGQISNWTLLDFAGEGSRLQLPLDLAYIDTSTPLFRYRSQEQMDAEMHLRSAPSFLAWILRIFFLEEVVDRYYDFRKVIIDLLANLYKEQKADLIPLLLPWVNEFLSTEASDLEIAPITVEELRSYYREDAFIWSLYLSMRRLDRFLHARMLRHGYPYILPGSIKR